MEIAKTRSDSKTDSKVWLKVWNAGPCKQPCKNSTIFSNFLVLLKLRCMVCRQASFKQKVCREMKKVENHWSSVYSEEKKFYRIGSRTFSSYPRQNCPSNHHSRNLYRRIMFNKEKHHWKDIIDIWCNFRLSSCDGIFRYIVCKNNGINWNVVMKINLKVYNFYNPWTTTTCQQRS